jgi:hypothetical protein
VSDDLEDFERAAFRHVEQLVASAAAGHHVADAAQMADAAISALLEQQMTSGAGDRSLALSADLRSAWAVFADPDADELGAIAEPPYDLETALEALDEARRRLP